MPSFGKFTYPFCYVPHPSVVEAANLLIDRIDKDSFLKSLFSEGKMLGTLVCEGSVLYGFSGLAGGLSVVDGFVPPILDLTLPDGHFKLREAEISAMPDGTAKAAASAELQDWIFSNYIVHNALGEELSVREVFALQGIVPPGGTGDCAAPKMLEYAYRNGLRPLAMGEFWYGRSPAAKDGGSSAAGGPSLESSSAPVREQGRFYPSCTGKCGPLLTWMMKGLDVDPNPLDKGFAGSAEPVILYEDDTIIVVDKPSGMLSVPGRTKAVSLLEWLQERYGDVFSCHRLDMDTSGLMVFARNVEAQTALERQFEERLVRKTYRARLCAPSSGPGRGRDLRKGAHGTIALPLLTDWYDRPRQMVDYEDGKTAVTEYEVLEVLPNGEIEILLRPLTGRTHQLRVHCAHIQGLGRPIKGDRLYGDSSESRLWLTADSLSFSHPLSGTPMHFSTCATETRKC